MRQRFIDYAVKVGMSTVLAEKLAKGIDADPTKFTKMAKTLTTNYEPFIEYVESVGVSAAQAQKLLANPHEVSTLINDAWGKEHGSGAQG